MRTGSIARRRRAAWRRLVDVVAFTASCFAATTAQAQSEPNPEADLPPASAGVVILAPAPDAVVRRLTAELEGAGLVVEVAKADDGPRPKLVRVTVPQGEKGAIEVWVATDGTFDLVERIPSDGPLDTRVLRAAELVRALALAMAPVPEADAKREIEAKQEVDAKREIEAKRGVARSSRRASPAPAATTPTTPDVQPPISASLIDLGLSTSMGLQPQGIFLGVEPTARFWLHPVVGFGFAGSIPIIGSSIAVSPDEHAFVRTTVASGEIVARPLRSQSAALVVGAGGGLAYVAVEADKTLFSDSFVSVVYGRAEARFRLTGDLFLTGGATVGVPLPSVVIHLSNEILDPTTTWSFFSTFSVGVLFELGGCTEPQGCHLIDGG